MLAKELIDVFRLIIYTYLTPTVGLIFLLVLMRHNHLFTKRQSQLFTLVAYVNLFMIVVTSLDYIFISNVITSAWVVRRITSFLTFAVAPFIPMILLIIFNQKMRLKLALIPFIANVILCFVSIFTKLVFFITPDNAYIRGPLFLVPFIITLFYVFLIVFSPVSSSAQGKRAERMLVISIMAVMFLSLYLEVFQYFYCINYSTAAIGLISYYMLQNINYFSTDSLTGVYNRRMYDYVISNKKRRHRLILVMMDINDFKKINDTLGHEAGDRALSLFANVVSHHTKGFATLYRIGGDEFMLISKKSTGMVDMLLTLNRADAELAKNNMQYARGIITYNPKDDLQEALRLLDKEMYENKELMRVKNQPNLQA